MTSATAEAPTAARPEDEVVTLRTLYTRLGVAEDATAAELKAAYRRQAHAVHPDAHPEDPTAPQRFQELGEAYNTLKDPERRAQYDEVMTAKAQDIAARVAFYRENFVDDQTDDADDATTDSVADEGLTGDATEDRTRQRSGSRTGGRGSRPGARAGAGSAPRGPRAAQRPQARPTSSTRPTHRRTSAPRFGGVPAEELLRRSMERRVAAYEQQLQRWDQRLFATDARGEAVQAQKRPNVAAEATTEGVRAKVIDDYAAAFAKNAEAQNLVEQYLFAKRLAERTGDKALVENVLDRVLGPDSELGQRVQGIDSVEKIAQVRAFAEAGVAQHAAHLVKEGDVFDFGAHQERPITAQMIADQTRDAAFKSTAGAAQDPVLAPAQEQDPNLTAGQAHDPTVAATQAQEQGNVLYVITVPAQFRPDAAIDQTVAAGHTRAPATGAERVTSSAATNTAPTAGAANGLHNPHLTPQEQAAQRR